MFRACGRSGVAVSTSDYAIYRIWSSPGPFEPSTLFPQPERDRYGCEFLALLGWWFDLLMANDTVKTVKSPWLLVSRPGKIADVGQECVNFFEVCKVEPSCEGIPGRGNRFLVPKT